MSKKSKYRDFTFLLYPESIPEDWETKLSKMDIEMAISPLHDKDKIEGETLSETIEELEHQKIFNGWSEEKYAEEMDKVIWKKPHYHVIYIAKNPVTAHAVRMRIQRLLGKESLAVVQPINSSVKSVYEYLTHESKSAKEENKHIYDKDDIKHLSGFDINNYLTLSKGEENKMMNKLVDIIVDNGIENYIQLERAIRDIERNREWRKRDEEKARKNEDGKRENKELTEEEENAIVEKQHEDYEKNKNDNVEDEEGEITLFTMRTLFYKKPAFYNSIFNGNYQENKRI